MSMQRSESRRTRFARAKISWVGDDGKISNEPIMMEDVTRSGAGFRIRFPLPIGMPLLLEVGEQIHAATVRHCNRDGIEFFVGIEFHIAAEDLRIGRPQHPGLRL